MEPTTVTSKGQVTIPKEIRQRLGIRKGNKVAFSLEDGHIELRLMTQPVATTNSGFGMLKSPPAGGPGGFRSRLLAQGGGGLSAYPNPWERRLGRCSRRGFWSGMASIPAARGAAPRTASSISGVVAAIGRLPEASQASTRARCANPGAAKQCRGPLRRGQEAAPTVSAGSAQA